MVNIWQVEPRQELNAQMSATFAEGDDEVAQKYRLQSLLDKAVANQEYKIADDAKKQLDKLLQVDMYELSSCFSYTSDLWHKTYLHEW